MYDVNKSYFKYLKESADEVDKEKKVKSPSIPIIYSDKFKEVLNSIKNMKTSNISKRLLEIENNKEKLFDMSYIDITDDGESITYLQSNRIDRFKKEGKSEEEFWTSKTRVKQKIGRFIKQVAPTFSDKSIEQFVNKFKTISKEEEEATNFDLVEGNDIVFWYNYKNYENTDGTMGGSCMSGNECGLYFGIYKDNTEQCKLLILKTADGKKIKGRALVWKLSKPSDKIFMDRVYSNKDSDEMLFTNYAKRQGWLYKDEQKYGVTNIIEPGKGSTSMKMEVQLEKKEFDYFPYVDTLRYYFPSTGILSNDEDSYSGEKYTLTDTEGKYQEYDNWDDEYDDPMVHDGYNDQQIPESQAVWCDLDMAYCHRNDALRMAYNGTFAFPNSKNIVYSEYSKKHYAKKDSVFSKPLNSWIWNKYTIDVYHDIERKQSPDVMHRFELNKTVGKVGDEYYDIDLLKVVDSKKVKTKEGKFKTENTYEFK